MGITSKYKERAQAILSERVGCPDFNRQLTCAFNTRLGLSHTLVCAVITPTTRKHLRQN